MTKLARCLGWRLPFRWRSPSRLLGSSRKTPAQSLSSLPRGCDEDTPSCGFRMRALASLKVHFIFFFKLLIPNFLCPLRELRMVDDLRSLYEQFCRSSDKTKAQHSFSVGRSQWGYTYDAPNPGH